MYFPLSHLQMKEWSVAGELNPEKMRSNQTTVVLHAFWVTATSNRVADQHSEGLFPVFISLPLCVWGTEQKPKRIIKNFLRIFFLLFSSKDTPGKTVPAF